MAGNGQHLRLRRCILGYGRGRYFVVDRGDTDEPVSPGLFGDGRHDKPEMLKVTVERYKR